MDRLGYVVGAIGLIASVVTIWQVLWPRLQFKISWDTIARNSLQIVEEMRRDNYRPDIIISAGRAGGILAALISGNYDGKKIQIFGVDMTYQWDKERRVDTIFFPKMELEHRKVLLTVGEVHTGSTLQAFVQACKENGATEIKTAALFHSEAEMFKPNYFGSRLLKQTRMPWHLISGYEKPSFPKAA
jgi:hypoxanthine phosphoribosyltransferase